MKTMDKATLVKQVSTELGLTDIAVTAIVKTLLDKITDNLAQGDSVVFRNFGSFSIRTTKAKVGRNPAQADKLIHIPAKTVVKFKAGKRLKEKVLTLIAS